MNTRGEAPPITRRRSVLACARCRARRVKCDRAQPSCSNCAKSGALCQPAQQQHANPGGSASMRPGRREPGDYNRLSKLEEEVARLSREVDSASPSRELSLSPSLEEGGDARPGRVPRGYILPGSEPKYFSPQSWVAAAEEVFHRFITPMM